MTTRTIGIKAFRQNMAKLYKKAKKEKICYIVMNHQEPIWRMEPIDEDQLILEKYADQIERGIRDFKQGKYYTADQVRKAILQKKG